MMRISISIGALRGSNAKPPLVAKSYLGSLMLSATTWLSDREAVRFGYLRSPPQPFEAPSCRTSVVDGVLPSSPMVRSTV